MVVNLAEEFLVCDALLLCLLDGGTDQQRSLLEDIIVFGHLGLERSHIDHGGIPLGRESLLLNTSSGLTHGVSRLEETSGWCMSR